MSKLRKLLELKASGEQGLDFEISRLQIEAEVVKLADIPKRKPQNSVPKPKTPKKVRVEKHITPEHLKGLRIAVDVQISHRAAANLKKAGFAVVVHAEHSETDDEWLSRAKKKNAELVVSDDKQVQLLAANMGMETLPLTGKDRNGKRLYQDILILYAEELR